MHVLLKNASHPIQNLHLMLSLPLPVQILGNLTQNSQLISFRDFNQIKIQFKVIAQTMSSLVAIILLCLSLHVCDARHLRLTKKEHGKRAYHFSKDVESTKVFEMPITSRLRPYSSEGCISHQKEVKNDERSSHDSQGGANKQKHSEVLLKKQAPDNDNSKVSFSQKQLQAATNTKVIKRKVRSLLASARRNAEETVDVKENDDVEDIPVMDYAQPHRKPPIHNTKP